MDQMSHLTKLIPPRINDKKTKRRKHDMSRTPTEPSDQIYTSQEKRQKDEKTTTQDLQISHLTKFIPQEKRQKTKRRKNDFSRPPNESSDQNDNSSPPNEPSDQIYTPRKKDKKTKK